MKELLLATSGSREERVLLNGGFVKRTSGLARAVFASGLIGSKLYIFGGVQNGGTDTADLSVYDIEQDTWTTLTTPGGPGPRRACMGAAYEGKFYVMNGSIGTTTNRLAEAYVYDPEDNSWTRLPNTPAGSHYGMSAAYSDGVHSIGGVVANNSSSHNWLYKPGDTEWTNIINNPSLPPKHGAGCVVSRKRIWILGGWSGSFTNRSVFTWSPSGVVQKSNHPVDRSYQACGELDGYIYMFGGSQNQNVAYAGMYRYDTYTDRWLDMTASLKDAPSPRYGGLLFSYNKKMYMYGGMTAGPGTCSGEVYEVT